MTKILNFILGWLLLCVKINYILSTTTPQDVAEDDTEGGWGATPDSSSIPDDSNLPGTNSVTALPPSTETVFQSSDNETYDLESSSLPEYSITPGINSVSSSSSIDDICSAAHCQNGGQCVNLINDYACNCPLGFSGKACQLNIDDCLGILCPDNAHCIDLLNDYECICNLGYAAADNIGCVANANGCSGVQCQEGHICADVGGHYECQCPEGFSGTDCLTNVDECESAPCQNGGTCYNGIAEYECQCSPGFTGLNCETNIDDCTTQPCQNGGQCIDGVNNYTCECPSAYIGEHCEGIYDACASSPCFNGASCFTTPGEMKFYCECLEGFEGLVCSHNINDCSGVTCQDGKVCYDLVDTYECRCPAGFAGDNCSTNMNECDSDPCLNGGTCHDAIANYSCSCPSGYTGHNCQDDVNECETSNPCINGICINSEGSYQCFCRPGFSGDDCSLEFDECLYLPCQNGGTCINKINSFLCECPAGFTGTKCETDINECESNPCQNGGTCHDGIAAFTCSCLPGFTDQVCATNIDECESNPCQNSGQCIDGIDEYSCNCSDTGFKGDHCEINIDDCLSNPCQHDSNCTDLVKDYNCTCHNGYTGKNCEEDIRECASNPCQNGGKCFEYSDMELYENGFFEDFSFETAGGFLCQCQLGFDGVLCEININECASNPCQNGICDDGINAYDCRCYPGYEGLHCEDEINECERFLPCIHGTCTDKIADYDCSCFEEFGGKNCSVELVGCRAVDCLNGGTCLPLLYNETQHDFECKCQQGFTGRNCELATTFSLDGDGHLVLDSSTEIKGYDLEISFRTTLPDVVLAVGQGDNHYFTLVLQMGRLKFHSSFLNRYNGIFLGYNLNNGEWQRIRMLVDSDQALLISNNETTKHSLSAIEHDISFTSTFLGGATRNLRLLFKELPFTGCFQDVVLHGQPLVPGQLPGNKKFEVQEGCSRIEQCSPNPCENSGQCVDLWNNFDCQCRRPYLGMTCKMSFTPATFGNEDIRDSLATVEIPPQDIHKYQHVMDLSLLIRTREKSGIIFYLGSSLEDKSLDDEGLTYALAKLHSGEIHLSFRLNENDHEFAIKAPMVDNGRLHLLQINRNRGSLTVRINGEVNVNATVPETEMLVEYLYIGGIPPLRSNRVKRQLGVPVNDAADIEDNTLESILSNFKGVIQDIRLGSGNETKIIELFPLEEVENEPFTLPGPILPVTQILNILNGTVSDDTCTPNPCLQGGTCNVTFNDFQCDCPTGFKGKRCDELEYCALHRCPEDAECRNLVDGYECVTSATFNGRNSTFSYSSNITQIPLTSLSTNFRSKVGGVLFTMMNLDNIISVGLSDDSVIFYQNNGTASIASHFSNETVLDGEWHQLNVTFGSASLQVYLDGFGVPGDNLTWLEMDFGSLIEDGISIVGGFSYNEQMLQSLREMDRRESYSTPLLPNATTFSPFFRGCLEDVRIADILLPFYYPEQLANNTALNTFILRDAYEEEHGCRVCFDSECENGGSCPDPRQNFTCSCLLGFEGDLCEVNIDECLFNNCENGALCVDGINEYICDCSPGYEGTFCEIEIDECLSEPCHNGGTCYDEIAAFVCQCPEDYIGETCNELKVKNCSNNRCQNGATCHDVYNVSTGFADNYTCECPFGYTGFNCQIEIDFCQVENIECVRGYCTLTHSNKGWKCLCEAGYEGDYCERETNECLPEPVCLNDGTCEDLHNDFRCHCQKGWKGRVCEENINECQLYPYICNGGVCLDTDGSYFCECPPGLCGENCTMVDPCFLNQTVCGIHGECMEICNKAENSTRYVCECHQGYEGQFCGEVSAEELELWIILLIVGLVVFIAGAILVACCCRSAMKRRETSGTYSPSKQEFYNPRVEMGNMMQPPPEERLI